MSKRPAFRITKPLFAAWLAKTDARFYGGGDVCLSCPVTMYARAHGVPGASSAGGDIYPTAKSPEILHTAPWIWEVQKICDLTRPTTGKDALALLKGKGIL